MFGRRRFLISAGVVTAVVLVLAGLYLLVVPGLSVARRDPPQIEVMLATWLLRQSVPAAARNAVNPLGDDPDPARVAAGGDLFRQKCEICHGYDGGGKTEIGAGQYPRPPALRTTTAELTDGEIFYHIRNGIRNTAMPAWNMPDSEIWQLVAYIRNLPDRRADHRAADQRAAGFPSAPYVGSAQCRELSPGNL